MGFMGKDESGLRRGFFWLILQLGAIIVSASQANPSDQYRRFLLDNGLGRTPPMGYKLSSSILHSHAHHLVIFHLPSYFLHTHTHTHLSVSLFTLLSV